MKTFEIKLLQRMAISLLCIPIASCVQTKSSTSANDAKFFTNPFTAVEQIKLMLIEKNWHTLAKYYDLTDSKIDQSQLESGEFFYTEEEPEFAHPAGFWKYKHPFSPAFKFMSFRELDEIGVIEVTVDVEIDQGGGMKQRGQQTFLMRKSDKGYQLLPPKESSP